MHLLTVSVWDYDWRGQGVLGIGARSEGVWAITAEGPVPAQAQRQPGVPAHTIAAAADGDEAAFAGIVAAHHVDMVRVCQVITRDAEAANDAAQQAWSIAWRNLRKLREPERLRQWLVAIAANEARQIIRHQRRLVVTELRAEGPRDQEEGTQVWGGRIDLRNALARLSAKDRELLALRYVAGFDSSELSRVTGLSPSGTRARLQRLLAVLRQDLDGSDV
jgi:RNA polymerase sigma-70 factor (ECF subfamily)